jgi:UrcA family protein
MAAGMLAISTPLFGAETDRETVIVHVGDLNLGTSAGMMRFERRVDQAARRLCGEAPGVGLHMKKHIRDCQDQVQASAMAELELAAAAAARSARS